MRYQKAWRVMAAPRAVGNSAWLGCPRNNPGRASNRCFSSQSVASSPKGTSLSLPPWLVRRDHALGRRAPDLDRTQVVQVHPLLLGGAGDNRQQLVPLPVDAHLCTLDGGRHGLCLEENEHRTIVEQQFQGRG
jgi:hypothetical protein